MFNEKFSRGTKFTFDSKGLPFIKLDDYIKQGGKTSFIVRACFVHSKNKLEIEHGVIVSDEYNIDVPTHLIKDIKIICSDSDMIEAVNNGKCGFKCFTYTDKFGVTRNSGTFVDV